MKKYFIEIIGKENKIITSKSNILLLILENNKIKINSQCRYGICKICKINLIRGKIKYLYTKPIIFSNPKAILPCCCVVISNVIIKL